MNELSGAEAFVRRDASGVRRSIEMSSSAASPAWLRLPVFGIYTFVSWFQTGLVPRDFGPPGSAASREWCER